MMETEPPQVTLPSRYRTIRRKAAEPQTISAAVHTAIDSQKPEPQTAQEKPLVRHKSRFRRMLRLDTSSKEIPAALPTSVDSPVPQSSKRLAKKPEKHTSNFSGDAAPRGLVATISQGGDAAQSPPPVKSETSAVSGEVAYDLKVPVKCEKETTTAVPIRNTTDSASLLAQLKPGKQRVLIECWPSLGFQRQVRHFELVSDVTNTWDSKTTCHLRVAKDAWGQTGQSLDEFSKQEPAGEEAQFYYYSKSDKKWSRRMVRLESGTLRIFKKDKPKDKDSQTINLEYFDVYSFVNPHSPIDKLKCPTKFCFVLKSQHKQSLFGKDSVYCHYFATDREEHLDQWFGLVRDWKSRLIAERRSIAWWTVESEEALVNTKQGPSPTGSVAARGRRKLQPLISPEELARPPQIMDIQRSKSLNRTRSTKRSYGKDQGATLQPPKSAGFEPSGGAVFSPGGLLGADYEEKRRQALVQYKEERTQYGHEFMPQSTPAGIRSTAARDPWQPLISVDSSQRERARSIHSGKSRSSDDGGIRRRETVSARPSTSHKQGPTLLNFDVDDSVPELPHRRGRGHTVSEKEARGKGGLISFARSAVETPVMPGFPEHAHKKSNTSRSRTRYVDSSVEDQNPFTGTGLLAGNYQSAGAETMGRGVANSKDAYGRNGAFQPLINTTQKSVFAPGSLLEKREREMGPTGPIIDRDPHSSDSE